MDSWRGNLQRNDEDMRHEAFSSLSLHDYSIAHVPSGVGLAPFARFWREYYFRVKLSILRYLRDSSFLCHEAIEQSVSLPAC